MTEAAVVPRRRGGRGSRPAWLAAKLLGLAGFLGGLLALGVLARFGPLPADVEGWRILRSALRVTFFPTVFLGLVVVVAAGLALFLQMPRRFLAMRWFRLKAALLLLLLPVFHFTGRGRLEAFDAALEAGRLDALAAPWRGAGTTFLAAFAAFAAIALIGRIKPRLGERPGSRATG